MVEQSDVRGVVRGDRIGARCVGVRSCRGRGGGDGTERTGRVARRQRGAVVEALEVESVRRGLHGCRLLQLPVSRSAEVQRKEVSCRETGKTGEKRRWSCQCRVAVESADRSGRAARRQNRHRGIVVEMSPHHLTRRTEEPGRAGGRAGGGRRARQNRHREVEAVRHSSVASRDLMRSEEEARAGGRHGTGEEGRRKEEVRRRDGRRRGGKRACDPRPDDRERW